MGFFSKIKEGLKKTRDSISGQITEMLNTFTTIDEDLFDELEELLVMGDVGVETASYITFQLRQRVGQKGLRDPADLMAELKDIVAQTIAGDDTLHIATRPSVILVIGVNGVGKTTTIGKLAARLKGEGRSVILGAADTFRAAAIEQLQVWADRAGVPMIKHGEGADPAAVVYDTLQAAKARGCDVVICDTAGRLHNKKNLMDELGKISRVIDRELPGCDRETLLVLDAATGQNAVNQAREFQQAAGITGIVLTKLDGTPKGGVVLPIKRELGLSVKFIGVGEQLDDLQPFDAAAFADALFDTEEALNARAAREDAEASATVPAWEPAQPPAEEAPAEAPTPDPLPEDVDDLPEEPAEDPELSQEYLAAEQAVREEPQEDQPRKKHWWQKKK